MSSFKEFISSKLFLTLGTAFLIFILVVEAKQFMERRKIQKEIDSLNAQSQSLTQKNQDLQNMISYFKTDDYVQSAARRQLNLKKDGEVVYSFQSGGGQTGQSASGQQGGQQSGSATAAHSNAELWLKYFFNK